MKSGTVWICTVAVLAGIVIGFVGGAFRWCLQLADRGRVELVDWSHHLPGPGWLVPIAVASRRSERSARPCSAT